MWQGKLDSVENVEFVKLSQEFPWKSKTKQRMVLRMIHVKDSLPPIGKVWFLDSLGRVLFDFLFEGGGLSVWEGNFGISKK